MQRSWLSSSRLIYPAAQCLRRRLLTTLAIETSCDDTSVAILEKHQNKSATLHFHDKITSDSRSFGGIHPLVAHESHQKALAGLVQRAVSTFGRSNGWKPDFITVTRGPGMRSSLTTGLDTAKGLSVAWQIPLLGVNHMQAHALTPRLVSALNPAETHVEGTKTEEPSFPFLTLLVSGGHTMLVHSKSLCDHAILANTTDLAIGDAIDKSARDILPASYLKTAENVMYGRLLEEFTFPAASDRKYNYTPPSSFNRTREVEGYDWAIAPPYSSPGPGGPLSVAGMFSYSSIGSTAKRIMSERPEVDEQGRRVLAREIMAVAFEHLASRVLFALDREDVQGVKTLVVSGGVASNQFLKAVLRTILDAKGHQDIELVFPPPKFCTDNAAMIAWTGMEMYEAGFRTSLGATAIRKWSIDPQADDGGILGVDEWVRVQ